MYIPAKKLKLAALAAFAIWFGVSAKDKYMDEPFREACTEMGGRPVVLIPGGRACIKVTEFVEVR